MAALTQAVDRADPGTRQLTRLEENIGAAEITLISDDLERIDDVLAIQVQGGRYAEAMERGTNL